MTFEEASKLTSSEKISLVTVESLEKVKLWNTYISLTYSRVVEHFVSMVTVGGVDLTIGPSKSTLGINQFIYVPEEKTVYISVGVTPISLEIYLHYKHFFSNAPYNLPSELSTGSIVEWLPYVSQLGSVGQQLDDDNIGIVLESQSSIDLVNNSSYFSDIFDKHIWESQPVNFYYWFKGTDVATEAKRVFSGTIQSKSFAQNRISFSVIDFVAKLRNKTSQENFSSLDGRVVDSHIGTAKRRIYGQVSQAQMVGLSCIKNGYPLTGTVTIIIGSNLVTGTGTDFLNQLSPNDQIIFTSGISEYKLTINSITSATSATIARASEINLNNQTCIVFPERPYRAYNRNWHICGHKIAASVATITSVVSANTFTVDSVAEFFPDDVITINGVTTQITRVSGSSLVLEQKISPVPTIGQTINKIPISGLYFENNSLNYNIDYTLSNISEAIVTLSPLAEFNIAKERLSSVSLVFTNGSRDITTVSTVDLRTIIKPRDWVRKLTMPSIVWAEVLSVDEQKITIRTAFTGTNGTEQALIKNVTLVEDNSLMTVSCYGISSAGKWLKSASDCVKHLLENDAEFSNLNTSTFTQADADCPYIVSMVIPSQIGQQNPIIRDVISDLNNSVFGSLYSNLDQETCFSALNTRKPQNLISLTDDDVTSWSTKTSQKIINQVSVSYQPFIDYISKEDSVKKYTYTNDFIDSTTKIKNIKEVYCYLFNSSDAVVVAQRFAFYNSLAQSITTIKAKALFFPYSVNDRVSFNFENSYKRFAGSTNNRIGIVSGVKKSIYDSEITINDLGNVFNRCFSISPSDNPVFTSSTDSQKINYGFILDTNSKTPDVSSEEGLGANLIG
jgi:hypothetical protein